MPEAATLTAQIASRLHRNPIDPGLALVFPGQGSHRVGAGLDLYEGSPLARVVFTRCDEALGFPLSQVCFEGPEESLAETLNAQPAILAVSLACLAAAIEGGALNSRPAFVAGHSLGEFSALVAAGSLELEDAVGLVALRARLMAEACQRNPGRMIAVMGLDAVALDQLCRETGVQTCNFNSSSQVVVAGRAEDIESATALAKKLRGRVIPLNVSGAFHTTLMADAAEQFTPAVEACRMSDPSIPVIGNSSAEPMTTAAQVRAELREQMVRPVLWHQSVQRMVSSGVTTLIEVGPGGLLTGLAKRGEPGLNALSLDSLESLERLRGV